MKQKNRISYFKTIFALLFFPITLTAIIIKSKKLKPVTKILLLSLFSIFICFLITSNYDTNISNGDLDISYEQTTSNHATTTAVEPNTKYHKNENINRLLTDYNKIAEYKISPEMIQKGAYPFAANIAYNGVSIIIYATSESGMFVDYQYEAANDFDLYVLYRDFCKTLNPEITNEDVSNVWSILQTEKYQHYTPYDFNGIDCTYSDSIVSNGDIRYIIKTNCKTYC